MPFAPKRLNQPKKQKAWQRNNAHLRKGLSGATRKAMKRRIAERDDYTCQGCGKLVELSTSHLDHVKALAHGGTHEPENLQTLCIPCSKAKTARESRGEGSPDGGS